MSTTTLIIIAVATAIIVAFAASRGRGPRVTTIETRREKDEGEKDA